MGILGPLQTIIKRLLFYGICVVNACSDKVYFENKEYKKRDTVGELVIFCMVLDVTFEWNY